jgi:uncharacterized membrane protein YkvA (DUF1232 family)
LSKLTKEVHDLLHLAADGGDPSGAPLDRRIKAISFLLYLLNPYDDVYDFYDGIGYQDGIAELRQVHASLFATTGAERRR